MAVSCTIIISHFESLCFLHTCVRQIRRYNRPDIFQHIIICDQSNESCYNEVKSLYELDEDITIIHTEPLWSGYGIDCIIRSDVVKTEYIAQIHVDAVPISKNWLYLPIKLIEENNFSFVGQLQFIRNPEDSIYPPGTIFAMAQCFNVAKTETYKEMSLEAGFTRFHNRLNSELEFKNDDWVQWAKEDYQARGSDDDVVAFHWEDKYCQHDKLGLAISGYIEPNYGRIIEDIVFHFGSCREALGSLDHMPQLYQDYTKKINENYSDELMNEMLALVVRNKPPSFDILSRNYWNGTTKTHCSPSNELNKRIEELKYE